MSFQMHLDVTLNQLAQMQPQSGMKVHMGFDRVQNGSLCSVKKKSGSCKGSLDLDKRRHCAGGQREEKNHLDFV